MEPVSVAHRIPVEIVDIILRWVTELHRVDAVLRAAEFKTLHRDAWATIMSDVRANTPRYTVRLSFDASDVVVPEGHNAFHAELDISLYLPDCDVWKLGARRDWPPAAIEGARRRALSVG